MLLRQLHALGEGEMKAGDDRLLDLAAAESLGDLGQLSDVEASSVALAARQMDGPDLPPLGVRIAMALSPAWRWRVGIAILCWLCGTGTVALRTHHPAAIWLFFGSVVLLLLLFSPARPRRRFWWSSGDWW